MTTRDPRSRGPIRPSDAGREGAREPTQSLQIEIDDPAHRESHPSIALGTSGDERLRDDRTKVESPGARSKPTPHPRPTTKPPPVPGKKSVEDPEHRLGEVLGAYRLAELLGKGGMGYVYRAEHVKLGREVALKLLRGDYAKRRDAVLRFFQEAKTVNRVRHRNIVDVTDFVELDDGTTFIIMELLRGQSLGKWARTGIDLPRALAVLVQICDGLGAAHAVGVVHRDLKPDNVIVVPTSDGAELVKLLDFGVAKLVNRDDEDIGFQTAAGSVIGTPAYMSPEQAGGMAVDHRSDIYSLGAIMYELFCGQPMFRGRSFGEYVRKHLTENPIPPRSTPNGGSIEPALEALILRCLAKDPNERFGHILELRDGLLHLLGGFETHPPGYAALAQSGLHPALPATGLPPHLLPLPAPMVSTLPTPPLQGHISQLSSAHLVPLSASHSQVHPSAHYSQYSMGDQSSVMSSAGSVHQQPSAPWWVWFVGGAVAVGLGIAGALWYAGRNDVPLQTAQTTQPTTAPIETPKSQLVQLRFDSLPSAGVFADGRSAELCKTPCNFNVDLADGGPTDRRTFVVRTDGYKDKPVVVDFAASTREFSVTLDSNQPTVPTVVDRVPEKTPELDTGNPADANEVAEPETHVTKGAGKKPGGKKTGKKTDDKKPEEAKIEDKKPEEKAEDTNLEPVEKKPEEKKPGKIDAADTMDPFSRKK